MRSPRPALAVTAVVMFALASCGGDEPSAGLLPPVPVRVDGTTGAGGTSNRSMAATADGMAEQSDMMFSPWRSLRFVAADGITLPSGDTGWTFPAGATPDPAVIDALAEALGVTGELAALPADQGGGWQVGPDDGTGPALNVSASGMLDWWYSNAWALDERSTTPDGVPDEATATALAAALVEAADLDVDGTTVDVWADEWSANVSYTNAPGEIPRTTGFGFGENGMLLWASGTLATPVAAGPYPLIDLDAAVQRLNDQYGFEETAREMVVTEEAILVDPAMGDVTTMPVPDGEPIDMTVTVTGASAGFWSAWDADGGVWFVPAYEFTADDGGVWTIPAVTDDFLIEDTSAVVEPLPDVVEPLPVDTPVTDPPATPDTLVTDGPIVEDEISDEEAQSLVGLSESEFDEAAAAKGWTVRVAERDGEVFALTADYSPTRVNVTYIDGIATAVFVG
jgi:hypothetical protein